MWSAVQNICHTDFGSEDYADRPLFRAHTIDMKTNDIRLGVAYKF